MNRTRPALWALEQARPYLVLVGVALVCTWPFLVDGSWPFHPDSRCHTNWFHHFARQFWAGELYPRWLAGHNGGLGSPCFFFYPPLPCWAASLLHPLWPGDEMGGRAMGWSVTLALALSGASAFLWLRSLTARGPALAGSILYLIAPCHLATDLYGRGALAEFWAFVWLPLILLFTHRVTLGEHRAVRGLAASYAALAVTHLPTVLTFSAVPPLYAWLMAAPGGRARSLGGAVFGLALGSGLAALYLGPALFMQAHITMEALTSNHLHYAHSLFLREFDLRTFNLGNPWKWAILWRALTMYALAMVAGLLAWKHPAAGSRRPVRFWLAVCAGTAFMTLPLSRPVWELWPTLQLVQFSWRFHTDLTVAAAALAALGLHSGLKVPTRWTGLWLYLFYVAAAGWFCIAGLAVHTRWFQGAPLPHDPHHSLDVPEYQPRTSRGDLLELAMVARGNDPAPVHAQVVAGEGSVTVAAARPRAIALRVSATSPLTVQISQLYFPGWTAREGKQRFPVEPSKPGGLILISVPAGNHTVLLRLEPSWPEQAGYAVSGLSLVVLLGLSRWLPRQAPAPSAS